MFDFRHIITTLILHLQQIRYLILILTPKLQVLTVHLSILDIQHKLIHCYHSCRILQVKILKVEIHHLMSPHQLLFEQSYLHQLYRMPKLYFLIHIHHIHNCLSPYQKIVCFHNLHYNFLH